MTEKKKTKISDFDLIKLIVMVILFIISTIYVISKINTDFKQSDELNKDPFDNLLENISENTKKIFNDNIKLLEEIGNSIKDCETVSKTKTINIDNSNIKNQSSEEILNEGDDTYINIGECKKAVILDINNDIDLDYLFNQTIKAGTTNVIINLDRVDNIDNSGIFTLIIFYSALKKVDGTLKLINMSDTLKKAFELDKLTVFFEIYDSEKDVINSYK